MNRNVILLFILIFISASAFSEIIPCRDLMRPRLTTELDEACKTIKGIHALMAVRGISGVLYSPTPEQVRATSKVHSFEAAEIIQSYGRNVSPEMIEAIAEIDTLAEAECFRGYDGLFSDPTLDQIKYCTSQDCSACHSAEKEEDKAGELAGTIDAITGQLGTTKVANSTKYQWDNAGFCNKHAPNGAVTQWHVGRFNCDAVAPSVYRFDSAGYCNRYTPNGATIEHHVARMHCR